MSLDFYGNDINTEETISPNVWTHLAVTRHTDNYIRIFAGGNLVYTSAATDGGSNYDSGLFGQHNFLHAFG